MKNEHWTMIGALATLAVLWLTWRSKPLASQPLGFGFDPATSDLTNYGPQDATTPNVAQLKQIGNNTPTYAGWGMWPFRTWGVSAGPVQSPSALPYIGIVAGQSPANADLITSATAQQTPSANPDPDAVAAYYAGVDEDAIDSSII